MHVLSRIRAAARRLFFWLKKNPAQEQAADSAQDHALLLAVTRPSVLPGWRQFRYLGRVLTPRESRFLFLFLGGALLLFAIGAVLLASRWIFSIPSVGGTYTEALIGEPYAINPIDALANPVDADLASLIYSGLFRMNGLEAVPDLAESYEWSEDQKTLTVHLRKDARFHNDQPVTADDVLFTIESIQDPNRNSLLAPSFHGTTVRLTDPYTIQFQLNQPNPLFLSALTAGILPATLWQDIPVSTVRLANLNLKPVGSGPYFVKSFTRDSRGILRSYALERFPQYYGLKPHIKSLVFQFYPDFTSAEDALKSDLIDALAFIPPLKTERFQAVTRWHNIPLHIPQQTVAFFNVSNDTLSNIDVRNALLLSVSREEIVEALGGRAAITETPYPFFRSPSTTAQDLEGARTLLDKAKWTLTEGDSIRSKAPSATGASSTPLALTISVPDQPDLIRVAEILKRQWSLLGIRVELDIQNATNLLRHASRIRDTQITLLNILLGPEMDLFPIWWSGESKQHGTNFSGLSEKSVDTAIQKTKTATSTESLEQARQDLSTEILKQHAAAFLVQPHYSYTISTRIKGVPDSMDLLRPSQRFQSIADWYIQTGWRWK